MMYISQLIARLELIKRQVGDIPVCVDMRALGQEEIVDVTGLACVTNRNTHIKDDKIVVLLSRVATLPLTINQEA